MYVRECFVSELVPQLLPLLQEHYEESDLARPVELKPDWPTIFEMNGRRQYRTIFLFTSAGELVGYLAFFILPSLHTRTLVATHDIFFVRKDWRIGRGALLLMLKADQVFKEAGVREVFASHQGVDKLDKLMKRFGYRHVGAQYYKAL